MIDKRAVCHEAGHAVVAMNFGLNVSEICVKGSCPTAMIDFTGATVDEACEVLAGGAAAEKVAFGGLGQAVQCDRLMIAKRGGGRLEDHLDLAVRILSANTGCHREIWNEASTNWILEDGSSIWSGVDSDKMNLSILSGTRIREIWQVWHP
jgi:hypothetical protein